MADIPLFPAGANIGPNTAPRTVDIIGSLDPTAYIRGLEAAKLQPSITTSIIEGLKQGAEFEQGYRKNESTIAALDVATQKTQQDIQMAPAIQDYKLGLLRLQEQNARNKALLDAGNLELNNKKQELVQRKENLLIASQERQLQKQSALTGTLDKFDLAQQSPALIKPLLNELTPSTIMGAVITTDVDDKGKRSQGVNTELLAQVTDLPNRIQSVGGTPEDIAYAQKIADDTRQRVNQYSDIAAKRPIKGIGETTSQPTDELTSLLQETGIVPTGKPATTSQTSVTTYSNGAAPAVPPQSGANQSLDSQVDFSTYGQRAPQEEPPAEQLRTKYSQIEEQDNTPISKRLVDKLTPKTLLNKVDKRAQELIDRGWDSEKAGKQALAEIGKFELTKDQREESDALYANLTIGTELSQRIDSALTTIDNLVESTGISPGVGEQYTLQWAIQNLENKINKNTPEMEQLITARRELDSAGNFAALNSMNELKFGGQQLINTDTERDMIRGLKTSTTNTMAQNRQYSRILRGKLQEIRDVSNIVDAHTRLGYGYNSGVQAANRYKAIYPSTTTAVDENGQPTLVENTQKKNPYLFVDEELHLPEKVAALGGGGPGETGGTTQRKQSSTPIQPYEAADNVEELRKGNIDYSNIPEQQPDGVSVDTVKSVIKTESGGNERAIGPKTKYGTAKGLMQFIDPTGKEMWSQLGFEGEYDPFDPVKNVAMGTAYLNKLSGYFGGNTRLAVAAYNAGPGNVYKAIDKATKYLGDTSWSAIKQYLPEETKNYVTKVMGDPVGAAKDAFRVGVEKTGEVINTELEKMGAATAGYARSMTLGADKYIGGALLDAAEGKNAGVNLLTGQTSISDIIENPGQLLGTEENRAAYEQTQQRLMDAQPLSSGVAQGIGYALNPVNKLFPGAGVGTKATTVANVVGKPGLIRTAVQTAKAAGTMGAIEGALKGADSWGEEALNIAKGGTIGAVAGAAGGAALQGLVNVLGPIVKIGPTQLLKQLGNYTAKEIDELNSLVKGSVSKHANIISETPDQGLKAVADDVARSPLVGRFIQLDAKAAATAQKKALPQTLGLGKKPPTNTEANRAASDAVESAGTRAIATRRSQGEAVYDAARQELTDAGSVAVLSKEQAAKLGYKRKTTIPVFSSKAIKAAEKNELVSRALDDARSNPAIGGNIPDVVDEATGEIIESPTKYSFEVVQKAIQNLKAGLDDAVAGEIPSYKRAIEQLEKAAYKESKNFKKANATYRALSEEVDETTATAAMRALTRVGDPEISADVTKFAPKILSASEDVITATMGKLTKQEQRKVQTAVRTHLNDMVDKLGESGKSDPEAFANFSKLIRSERLEAIFGADEGAALMKTLNAETRAAKATSGVLRVGSQTQPREEQSKFFEEGATAIPTVYGKTINTTASVLRATFRLLGKHVPKFAKYTDEEAKEISKILLDKKAGVEFLDKMTKELKLGPKDKAELETIRAAVAAGMTGSAELKEGKLFD